ncbi:MAG: putative cell division protein ZapA [Pseudomonadota bacterium]|jgi:cell division protein ZapA
MIQPPASRKLEVQIMDQSYTLSCPPGSEVSLMEAVSKVDSTMCAIRDSGRIKSRDRIAVLACINIAHELVSQPGQSLDAGRRRHLAELLQRLDQALAANDHPA